MNTSRWVYPFQKKIPILTKKLSPYYWQSIFFIGSIHIIGLIAPFWIEIRLKDILLLIILYFISMFGITVGCHRYFSHKSFKTSRIFQFILAILAHLGTQSSTLWWADRHRLHHRDSDTIQDIHSPITQSFLYAHFGWVFMFTHAEKKYTMVKDLERYPELCWLDRCEQLITSTFAIIIFFFFGWSGFVIGFCLSRILCWHSTFCINSIAHLYGSQRYNTGDHSRNSFWVALLTLGDGWHNNHHYYASSARHGFYWWEVDIAYYILVVLSWLGIVWDLKKPPENLLKAHHIKNK